MLKGEDTVYLVLPHWRRDGIYNIVKPDCKLKNLELLIGKVHDGRDLFELVEYVMNVV